MKKAISLHSKGAGRDARSPAEIPAKGWWAVLKRVYQEVDNDRVMLTAAGVTFYLLLALFPALAAFVSLYGFVADPITIADHIAFLGGFLPAGGGMGLKRKGEKQADYLVKAGMLGNLAIVEIKTTETPLLTKNPYRPPNLYGPHPELTGGVNQLVDQKLRLIKSIAAKKEEEEEPSIQAWSVPCILIIGRLPEKKDEKQSFEIYRGSQKDVLIITFDELVALHEFLITKPDEVDQDIAKLV